MCCTVAETFLKTKKKKIFNHIVTVCEPLIFEDLQCEMDRSLNIPSIKALNDYDNEHNDVSLTESNKLSLEQQKCDNKMDTYEKLMNVNELARVSRKDIENNYNYKSKDEKKNEEQIEKTKMKGLIACENADGKDSHFVPYVDDVKKLQDKVLTTNHQDSTTDYDVSNPVADDLEISHTLIVSEVTADDVDAVELYLESSKKGGGHIKRQIYDKSKEILEVIFDSEKGILLITY